MRRYGTTVIYALVLFIISSKLILSADNDKIPITTKSETAKNYFIQAREAGDNLEIKKAQELYTKAIQEDPDFALAYSERSGFQNNGKDFVADVEKSASLLSNVSEGEKLIIEATQANLNRDVEKQRDNYEKLVSSFPNDERAHTLLGAFYTTQAENDKAVTEFQKSIDINPKYSPAFNLLGYAYKNQDKLSDAEVAFKKYISLIPNNPNPYDSYAELLLKEGKFDESIQNYQKALSIDPDFNSSRTGIAAAHIYQGHFDQARNEINDYLQKATTNPDKETAHRLMAISYIYEGNLDKALAEFDNEYKIAESESDYPDMSNIQSRIGTVLYENGKFDEAKEKFKSSTELFDKSTASAEAKTNYRNSLVFNNSLISLNQDNTTAAAKPVETDIKNPALVHQVNAVRAIMQKDGDASLNELKQANQNDPYILYLMGRAYQLKGDEQNAKQYFDKAISYNGLPTVNNAFAYYNAKKYSQNK